MMVSKIVADAALKTVGRCTRVRFAQTEGNRLTATADVDWHYTHRGDRRVRTVGCTRL
jgi:hypothetical protein